MDFQIDHTLDDFLVDHTVDGVPLVPTVMQLDLAARAVLGAGGLRRLTARRVVVGAPLIVPRGRRVTVHVDSVRVPSVLRDGVGRGHRSQVTLSTAAGSHLTACLVIGSHLARRQRRPQVPLTGPRIRTEVYPPFFHGPRFRVVGDLAVDPETDPSLDPTMDPTAEPHPHPRATRVRAAWLAPGLPPLRWAFGPTVTGPRVLELLLQCCGLADLCEGHGMRVPASIAEVRWYDARSEPAGTIAVIRPRRVEPDGGRAFDAAAYAAGGSLLVTMRGYRTVPLSTAPTPSTIRTDREAPA